VISGTPTTAGTSSFTVEVTDANSNTATHAFSNVTIAPAALAITTTSLQGGNVNTPYSQTISATGGTTPYTFAISSGTLPTGLTLSSSGVISGTPTSTGTFTFTVSVTDANSSTATQTYSNISIGAQLISITPTTLPAGTTGTAYSQTITATGGTAPYTFTVTSGNLPTGLSLSTSGVISGTPSATGTFTFTVGVTDTNGSTATEVYSNVSIAAPVTVTLTSVNGGSSMTEGSTGVPVVGTGFTSGITATITQPGGITVNQRITYVSSTSATLNLVVEPSSGDQLAYTDSTYTTNFTVSTSGGTSSPLSVTITPPSGIIFQTATSLNITKAYRLTGLPRDIRVGDQVRVAGNSAGTQPAPTGLVINSDMTWYFTAGSTPQSFWTNLYDSVNKVWGSTWTLQTV
jgi:hypothetical protein